MKILHQASDFHVLQVRGDVFSGITAKPATAHRQDRRHCGKPPTAAVPGTKAAHEVVMVQATRERSSRPLDTTLAGDAMVIAEAGKPMMCSPVDPADREPGAAAGKARLTDAFFEPLPAEVLTDFESNPT